MSSSNSPPSTAGGNTASLPLGTEGQYCFLVEWFDAQASLMRQYHLLYYLLDETLELYDIKNRRTFLKRCSYPSITLRDLYIGSQVTIYSRQLRILAFGDEFTTAALRKMKGKTLLIVKPSGVSKWGTIISLLTGTNGSSTKDPVLKFGRMKTLRFGREQAQEFVRISAGESQNASSRITETSGGASSNSRGSSASSASVQQQQRAAELTGGNSLAIELIGTNVSEVLSDAIRRQRPSSSGRDTGAGGVDDTILRDIYLSTNERISEYELDYIFSSSSSSSSNSQPTFPTTTTFSNCTFSLIKPHILQSGQVGSILTQIYQAGFDITALELFNLDKISAEEFMEVYKGVVPEYFSAVEQLVSGPVIALEIKAANQKRLQDEQTGESISIVSAFRSLVGPSDPEIAKHIRAHTLRAQFGQNKIKNAVHCTDLEEDGVLETQFFFEILQQQQQQQSAAPQAVATQRR